MCGQIIKEWNSGATQRQSFDEGEHQQWEPRKRCQADSGPRRSSTDSRPNQSEPLHQGITWPSFHQQKLGEFIYVLALHWHASDDQFRDSKENLILTLQVSKQRPEMSSAKTASSK
jgi:hypothetical protein